MRSVTVRGTVDRAIEDVFDFLADARNDERWCPLASDVELVEGDGPGPDAVYRFTQGGPPGTPPFTAWLRTVVHERPSRLSWDNADRGNPYLAAFVLTDLGGRTRIEQTNTVGLPKPAMQLAWFLGAQVVLRRQLRNLRAVLES